MKWNSEEERLLSVTATDELVDGIYNGPSPYIPGVRSGAMDSQLAILPADVSSRWSKLTKFVTPSAFIRLYGSDHIAIPSTFEFCKVPKAPQREGLTPSEISLLCIDRSAILADALHNNYHGSILFPPPSLPFVLHGLFLFPHALPSYFAYLRHCPLF